MSQFSDILSGRQVTGPAAVADPVQTEAPVPTVSGLTPEMQRQYQLLKGSGLFGILTGEALRNPYSDDSFNAAFTGAKLTPQDIFTLTGGEDRGVTQGEWDRLSPEIRQAILNDPATFLRGQLGKTTQMKEFKQTGDDPIPLDWSYDDQTAAKFKAAGIDPVQWQAYTGNGGGSGDLLSVGAEGGIKDYNTLKWVPGVGLVHPRSDYMQVRDNSADIVGGLVMGALTGGFAAVLSPAIGALGTGAVGAGMNAANTSVNGGNVGKTALSGLLSAGVGDVASGLTGTTAGVANSTLANYAGRAAVGAALGQSGEQIAGGLIGSAAGGAIANSTNNNALGGFGGALISRMITNGTAPSPNTPDPAATPAPGATPTTPAKSSVPRLTWN